MRTTIVLDDRAVVLVINDLQLHVRSAGDLITAEIASVTPLDFVGNDDQPVRN